MFHHIVKDFDRGNGFYHTCFEFFIQSVKMACCCPNLFRKKKTKSFDAEFDIKIEPKKNEDEQEIQSGKKTSMVNMSYAFENQNPSPDLTPNQSSQTVEIVLEPKSKVGPEMSFEEEVYKELEIDNSQDFQPKIELKQL